MKNLKKIVAVILCMMTLVTALPLTSFAAYENTHVNTGNQIEDLIAVATTQIGYTEGNTVSAGTSGTTGGSGNYTKYGAWYGINPGAWCAMFVSWCANQAGISSSIIPKHASCDIGMQTFQQRGRWQWSKACGGSYTPKRGDIIYFRTKTNQVTDSTHVGIIYDANASTIYTIEGNASNKCQKKSYSTSSAYILGYGTPNYTSGTAGYTTGQYKVTASSLNMRDAASSSGTNVLQALPTNAVVNVTLVYGNWGYCSYNGITGWIHLGYTVYLGSGGTVTSTYTITFDPGNGTITSGSSSYQISEGMPYAQVISDIPGAARNGYVLGGWYCYEYEYLLNLNDTFAANKNVTFTAIWTPVYGVYEVTAYNLNMRSGAGSSYGVVQVLENGDQINVSKIEDKWGYGTYNGISGWFSLNYCVYVGESFDGYILTFNPNGGTMPESYSTTYTFQADEKFINVIGGFPVPIKEGYEFAGWQWANRSDHFWTDGWGTQPYTFDQNITVDAVWTTHTCSFTQSGTTNATCTEPGVTTYSCTCGESYTEETPALDHDYKSTTTAATCTAAGKTVKTCSRCGDSTTTTIAALGHAWGDWVETTAPTTTSTGVETRTCSRCLATETQDIPMLSVDTPTVAGVNNYTVVLNGISDVKEIRFAIGEYTTVAQIREAEGNLTLSASLAANYIVDGVFTYDVAYSGRYTFCIRHNDGTNDFLYVDVNDINTYLESDGLRLTVKDMKEASLIKDMWIAEGTWETYTEIKNNVAAGAKYQATATKLANYFATNDFTYTTANPGAHTVLIRYNDGSTEALYINLTVDVPTFTQNGLQLTIGNIPGVKIIRSAYGEYNSITAIKKAPLLRCFNNKTAIKDAEEYMIQYREAGVITVIVEYTTGYKHVEHITIEPKTSTLTQDGNKVTISDIQEGFMMVRYAEGTYKTAGGVKNAVGSKYVKAESVVDGKIVIENLAAGTYTFCVQYDDESYNFYTITVK